MTALNCLVHPLEPLHELDVNRDKQEEEEGAHLSLPQNYKG